MSATRIFTRAVIALEPTEPGEDVRGFLQALVTQDVSAALPVWAGLLTPQGKVLFDFTVWEDGERLLLLCEAAAADALVKRLSLYRLRRAISIARDDHQAVHWSPEPGNDPRMVTLGSWWLAPARADDKPADAAWRAHRLSLGVAEGRAELGDGDTLWLECNAAELNGVSFTKGCYIGQENTARMNWRAKVNRRLLVVPLARSNPAWRRAQWPDLGLALDLARMAECPADLLPGWLAGLGGGKE